MRTNYSLQKVGKYQILILEGCKPFSINKAYYLKTMTLTREARLWRSSIFAQLRKKNNQASLEYLRSLNDGKIGYIINMHFYVPEKKLFTKAGGLSANCMDLSNVEKLLQDVLLNKRFYERKELKNLNTDDKLVVRLVSEKLPADRFDIVIKIQTVRLLKK